MEYSLKDETFELKDLGLQDDVISIRELSGGKVIMATAGRASLWEIQRSNH